MRFSDDHESGYGDILGTILDAHPYTRTALAQAVSRDMSEDSLAERQAQHQLVAEQENVIRDAEAGMRIAQQIATITKDELRNTLRQGYDAGATSGNVKPEAFLVETIKQVLNQLHPLTAEEIETLDTRALADLRKFSHKDTPKKETFWQYVELLLDTDERTIKPTELHQKIISTAEERRKVLEAAKAEAEETKEAAERAEIAPKDYAIIDETGAKIAITERLTAGHIRLIEKGALPSDDLHHVINDTVKELHKAPQELREKLDVAFKAQRTGVASPSAASAPAPSGLAYHLTERPAPSEHAVTLSSPALPAPATLPEDNTSPPNGAAAAASAPEVFALSEPSGPALPPTPGSNGRQTVTSLVGRRGDEPRRIRDLTVREAVIPVGLERLAAKYVAVFQNQGQKPPGLAPAERAQTEASLESLAGETLGLVDRAKVSFVRQFAPGQLRPIKEEIISSASGKVGEDLGAFNSALGDIARDFHDSREGIDARASADVLANFLALRDIKRDRHLEAAFTFATSGDPAAYDPTIDVRKLITAEYNKLAVRHDLVEDLRTTGNMPEEMRNFITQYEKLAESAQKLQRDYTKALRAAYVTKAAGKPVTA